MNKHRYRVWCGLIIKSNTFTYVRAIESPIGNYYEIIPERKELVIHFTHGTKSNQLDLPFSELIKNEVLHPAEFELLPCAYIDGFEFYSYYDSPCDVISQYLITDDIGSTRTALVDGHQFIITLNKSFLMERNLELYINLVSASKYIYPKLITEEFTFHNYPFVEFNGIKFGSNDTYIYGTTEAFAVNAVTNISEFVRALEETYPNISIFVDDHDRDESKSEWIQVKSQLDEVSSGYHTIVHDSPDKGRWSQSSARVTLEYTTNDIILSLTRRDQYLHGKFLNEIRVVEFTRGETKFGCSIFWERNDITTEKPVEDTSFDNSGYRLFTFNISCILYFKIAELVDRKLPTILQVIYQMMEESHAIELDKRVVIFNEEN